MIKRKIILICFIFMNLVIYSQKTFGEVFYEKKMLDIKNNRKKVSSKNSFFKFREKINKNLKKVTYSLIFNETESLFFSSKIMEKDIDRSLKLAINFGGGRGILYTNIKTKLKLHQADGYGERFLINGEIKYNWIITQETKKIDKYLCYKAILKDNTSKKGKDIIAWFSPEIPFSFGPNGYCALPGLILELELSNGFLFKAVKINLKKNNLKKIIKPKKGVKISEEEFLKIGKETMRKRN